MLRDTISSPYFASPRFVSFFLLMSNAINTSLSLASSAAFCERQRKEDRGVINFLYTADSHLLTQSHLNPKKKRHWVHTTSRKNSRDKFEMENLLIMSTVFSMRFITQMLIFQPTPRVSVKRERGDEKNSISQIDLYREPESGKGNDGNIDFVANGDSLALTSFYLSRRRGYKKGTIIYNRIKSRDGHYVVIINCTRIAQWQLELVYLKHLQRKSFFCPIFL